MWPCRISSRLQFVKLPCQPIARLSGSPSPRLFQPPALCHPRGPNRTTKQPIKPHPRGPDRTTEQAIKPVKIRYFTLIVTLTTIWELIYLFGYEPLRERGIFDIVAQSTIFAVVGPKRVKPESEPKTSEPAPYQPIRKPNEIRLLVLEPGQRHDEIRCTLANVRLSWRTRFEALSYTWGDPKITMPIKLSGNEIEVTKNLHSALQDLRYTDRPRSLWVDAVCINQADLQEKAQQILLMGSIYSRARRVLIYLGATESDVDQSVESIKHLNSKMRALHVERYMSRLNSLGSWTRVLFDYLPSQKPLPPDFDWQPIVRLLQRPWFERTWIIQEAILARRGLVVCGDRSVPWLLFERVAHDIYTYHHTVKMIPGWETIQDAVEGLEMMRLARRDQWRLHTASISAKMHFGALREYSKILDLLFDTKNFKCTDPRDKVYGLLGLTNQKTQHRYLHPNYSLPVEEVFKSFVLWEVLVNRSLRVLGINSDNTSAISSLPSWAPDFTHLPERTPLLRRENRVSFRACGNSVVEAQISEDETTLCLKGQVMDKVHTLATRQFHFPYQMDIPSDLSVRKMGGSKNNRWYRDLQMRKEWLAEVLSISSAAFDRLQANKAPLLGFYTPATKADASVQILGKARRPEWELLWRTLTCNHTDHLNIVPNYYREWVIAYTDLVREGLEVEAGFIETWLSKARNVEQGIAYFSKGRRFAGTDGGLIGWVPEESVEGDVIVIPYGSKVPLVVRSDGKGGHRVVGDCYIHGLMDGQAINAPGKQERETTIRLV
ncbi:heterokaryon incompatibility protein-domain-containing protein [Nemania sp. NC0429]|nr:heterokaryon incompatibility protein-domain-containing protein [Nemania sp. NC0429]